MNAAARTWRFVCVAIAVGFAKLAFVAGDPGSVALTFAVLAHLAAPKGER